MNNRKNISIKIIVSICFFLFIASFVEKNQLLTLFNNLSPLYFGLSILLIPIMLCASCLKWKILLDAGGHQISFLRLINIYLVGYFFSNLLPSTVGGDVARTYYAGKEINNIPYAAVTVFIERFTGFILLLLLVIFAPAVMPDLYRSLYFLIPALSSFALLGIIVTAWMAKDSALMRKLSKEPLFLESTQENMDDHQGVLYKLRCRGRKLIHSISLRFERLNAELRRAFQLLRKDKILLTKIAFLTFLFYVLTWVNVYIAYLTFGRSVEFIAMIALVPTIMLVSHLPVSFLGNLGFFESVFIFYFLMVGIPGEETLAMSLLLRFKLLCLGGVGFGIYLAYRRIWGKPTGIDKVNELNAKR